MSVSIDALGITRLTVSERLELIEQIWNSLPVDVAPSEVTESHLAELAIRRANARSQPALGKPWREVLDSLQENR
jgi:putative addiction module component (TIGR02574 family)